MAAKDELGRRGEDEAVRYLERRGLVVLSRNWRCRDGELDVVATDADALRCSMAHVSTQRQPRAAVYCRISDDREGRELGVQRQEEDCRARATREGWAVGEVFTDNDLSASTRSRRASGPPCAG